MVWMAHLHRMHTPLRRWSAWVVLASAMWAALVAAAAGTENPPLPPAAVQVQDGDMASVLAFRLKPKGSTIEQMMVALLRINPEAFLQGNVNLLRGNATLRLPPPEDVFRIPPDEARDTVQRHHQNFLSDLEASTKALSAPKPVADTPTEGAPQANAASEAASEAAAERAALLEKLRTAKAHLSELQQNIQELERLTHDEAAASEPAPTAVNTPVPESWIWLGVAAIVAVMVGVGASRRSARPEPADPDTDAQQAAAAAQFQARLGTMNLDLGSPLGTTSGEQPK
jgi:pilus assembly protein FimV